MATAYKVVLFIFMILNFGYALTEDDEKAVRTHAAIGMLTTLVLFAAIKVL